MLTHERQKGFGLLEFLIILLLILLLILGGWYVWHRKSDDGAGKKAGDSSESAKSSEADDAEPDPTSDWVTYSNAEGDFSFKHPAAWVQAPSPELCSEGLALFGANEASVGRCASESGGQMVFSSMAGDLRADYAFTEGFADVTEEAVTVEGVAGTKAHATAAGMEGAVLVGGFDDGTEVTRYVFFTGGRTYQAQYVHLDTYPDSLSDFNLLMTHTFRFSE
jgi:hypothetical protein